MIAVALMIAAAAAPQLEWHTIHSECCDVHYPIELDHVARRVANIADDSVKNASEFLSSAPQERVQIVIHDVTDSPNGFTNVVPYDDVDLRTVTPESDSELGVTDEYLRLLVQHEILHVVHLDTIHGLPALVNIVVGKVWPPNLIQPRFVVEGLAVLAESRFTGGGRLRSTAFATDLLIAALDGDLWQLDDLANYSRRGPGGGAAYAYGAAFVAWLTEKYGAQIWPAIAHDYGGSIIPFAVQRSIEAATGHDVERDYSLFLDDVRAQAELLRAAAGKRGGPTKARRLTRFGGTVHRVAFDKNGALVFGLSPPNGAPGVYALDADLRVRALVRTTEAADVAVVDDTLVVAQTETTRGYYSFHDLWRTSLPASMCPSRANGVHETGGAAGVDATCTARAAPATATALDEPDTNIEAGATLTRITREARVRGPSWVPGTRSVVAEMRTALRSALVAVDVDTKVEREIVGADDGTLFYTPDVSPDGAHVVVSRWSPGGARQVVEVDMGTGAQRILTDDGTQSLDPAYTVDGKYVLFTSDREGMFCIYAVDRQTREVRRIVDSLGLAKFPRPTPDGSAVVYVDTDLDGNDLYAAPLDIAHAPVVEEAPPAPPYRAFTSESRAPDERYNAFFTLLPRYYIPLEGQDPAGGLSLGVAVVGNDAVGQLSASAQASWGFLAERPHLAATVRFADLYLPISLNAEYRESISDAVRRTDGQPDDQIESVLATGASVAVPLARSDRYAHSIGFGYQREFHVVENPVTSHPDAKAPVYPPDANVGAVTFDWGYSGIESYRDSISNERGFTSFLHLRHADKLTLSKQDITEAVFDARAFTPVPGLGGHVVGVYLSGGVAFGDRRLRDNFFLGGFTDRDITNDLLTGQRSAAGVLRGYPRGAMAGDDFGLVTLEYRFPLLEVERGISTLPLFLDRVHAAAFTDLGGAFVGVPDATGFKASVGVELRAQVTLAYYGLFLIRVGYARGVSRGGIDQPYAILGFPY